MKWVKPENNFSIYKCNVYKIELQWTGGELKKKKKKKIVLSADQKLFDNHLINVTKEV